MYRQCTLPKSVATQIRYEECLLELMKEKPYKEITINDICAKMGTTRKSFYHFFKNKDGCIYALIDRMFFESREYQPPEFDPKGYPPILIRIMQYQLDHRDVIDALIQNDLTEMMLWRQLWLIRENLQNREQQLDPHVQDASVFYTCGLMGILHTWHLNGYQRTVYELAESLRLLMSPEHPVFG